MSYFFDPDDAYFYDEAGTILSRQEIMALIQESINASWARGSTLAELVSGGGLSSGEWAVLLKAEIKQEYIRQYLLGRGGLVNMTQKDWGRIGSMLKEQYKYLKGFEAEIASGNLTVGQIAMRSDMYLNSSREAFERANAIVHENAGFDEEIWVLGVVSTEHCPDCVVFSELGWQPFDTFPTPGDGSTLCVTSCGCTKDYRKSEQSLNDLMDIVLGNI